MPSTGLSAIPRIELRPLLNATAIWQDLPKICNNNQERGPKGQEGHSLQTIQSHACNVMRFWSFLGHSVLVQPFLEPYLLVFEQDHLDLVALEMFFGTTSANLKSSTCISSPLTSTFWKEVTFKSKGGSTRGVLTFMLCTCLLPIPSPSYYAALEFKRW